MLLPVPRSWAPRLCSILGFTLLLIFVLAVLAPAVAAPFVARNVGDFNQIAVIEVDGNFDALDLYGQVNSEPRRVLAREFYRTHGDDYDFLVFFTNFDVRMPTVQAKAFFTPARNNVQGIGLPLYDHTRGYSVDGSPLERLEGTIDMGNHAAHVLEPTDPRFETTLRVLTHELLHRWGAYVRFLDAGIESEALLGREKAHWSFLHDSGGSTLYGNRWQDNADGTFTALTPESASPGELFGRLLNPLELYLMGFTGADQVPPLTLIEAPGIDTAQLPAPGVTIPGVLRTVSIDDIIAREGARLPAATDSRKELRAAFILAVAPGSFQVADPAAMASFAAIGRLQREWEKRFSILTDGQGRMHTALVKESPVEANPAVAVDYGAVMPAASIDAAVNWLMERQHADGRWEDQPGTKLRDTVEVVKALKMFPAASGAVARGREWLAQATAANHDFSARQLGVGSGGDLTRLLAETNGDGGWGGAPGFRSNPLDTALVLQALAEKGIDGSAITAACNYLHASQQADGGWSAGAGPSQLQSTCAALQALNGQRSALPLEASVVEAKSWLLAARNGDGGFGQPLSGAVDSALALLALKVTGALPAETLPVLNWLVQHQLDGGSWQGCSYATALALQALQAAQMAPDLAISGAEIGFDPPMLANLPGDVTVSVGVRNLGSEPVASASIALYAGDPAAGGALLSEQQVSMAGNAVTQVIFAIPVTSAGVHRFFAVADHQRAVSESDEWNNVASKILIADLPPPTVSFSLSESRIAENAGEVALQLVMNHPWYEAVTVNFATAGGRVAVPGVDYLPSAGAQSIPAGDTSAAICLQLFDDTLAEADKELVVNMVAGSSVTIGQGRHLLTVLDDEPPALSITSPQPTAIATDRPLLLFTTTAELVEVRVDGQLVNTSAGEALGPLTDGAHQLEVTVTNGLGLSTRQQVDFSIDSALPAITVMSPPSGCLADSAPLLQYTIAGATTHRLTLDGNPLTKNSGDRLDPLADGEHVLLVTAWNAAGAEVSTEVRFSVDTVAPVIELIYPAGDVLREATPMLFCRIEGGVMAAVQVDGMPVASSCGDRLDPLEDGPHRVEISAVDEVGNQATAGADFIVYRGVETPYPPALGWPRHALKLYGGLAVDSSGNVYLATQDSTFTLMIQKFSSRGTLLWQKRPFAVILNPRDLAVDAKGNLFVVGYNGNDNGFLYKFSSVDGSYLAGHSFATAASDYALAVQVDKNGQVVVGGDTGGNLFGSANGTMNVWVARFDNDCQLLAACQLTRSGMQELTGRGSLALDREGNVYLSGTTDTATFGAGRGGRDAFVVKFSQGLWPVAPSLQFGTSGNDEALDVWIDVYGHILVGGVSVETSHFFESGFLYKFDAAGNLLKQISVGDHPVRALAGECDGTLYAINEAGQLGKYDRDLNLLWSQSIGWNYRYQLVMDPFGDLFVAGDGGTSGGYASILKLTDSRRPSITLDAAQLQINRGSILLGGTVAVGAAIELVNPELHLTGPVAYPQAGRWQVDVAGLPEGVTTVVLEAKAPSGFTRRIQATVTVDVTPPQVVIASPADNQFCREKTPLVYSVSDGRVEVLVNGVPLYKASGQPLEFLRPGWNTVRVEATDSAGNTGYAVIRIFAEGAAVGEMPLSEGRFSQTGTVAGDTVGAVAKDAAGNIFLLGHTSGNFPGYANAGGRDPYVAKFDVTGRHLATWQYGAAGDESGGCLAVNSAGDLLMAWNVQTVGNKGQVDMAIRLAKISAYGVLVWQAELNSSANDLVYDLALTANGDLLLAGETFGSLDKQRYGGGGDYFIAKFSGAGGKQWVRLSNSADHEAIHALATDRSGAVYGAVHIGSVLAGVPVPDHVALVKFDASGTLLKVEPLHLPGSDFVPKELLIDAGGRLLTAASNGSRYILAAHDPDLARQWQMISPAEESATLSALAVDPAGNLYVGGQVVGSFAGNRAFGGSDGVIVKHTPTGGRQWSWQYGSPGNDYVAGAVWGGDGVLWLGGHTDGPLGGSPSGLSDLYLAGFTQPEPLSGPVLTIDPHRQLINNTDINLSGTTTHGAIVEIETATPSTPASVLTGLDGSWQASVTGLQPESANQLKIISTNELGSTCLEVTVTVDTLPPLLSVNNPPDMIQVPEYLLSGTVEPGAGLLCEHRSGQESMAPVEGVWSCRISGLQAGDNLLTVRATDAAGNVASKEVNVRYLPPPPPTLSLTPTVIGSSDKVDLVLSIGQVVPVGSTVTVSRVLDLNNNGHAESDEPVTGFFTVTDGVASPPSGQPGDSDGRSDGAISVHLNGHFVNDRFHAAGEYLYVVASPGGSAGAGFSVLAQRREQAISGTVREPSGTPVPGVLIELTDLWGYRHGFVYSDQAGNYRYEAAVAGDYRLWPEKPGYVSSRLLPTEVRLAAGEVDGKDLVLQTGDLALSGVVYDGATLSGVAGVWVRAVSTGYQAVALSGPDGAYSLKLPAGDYQLYAAGDADEGWTGAGCLAESRPLAERTVTADLTGIDLIVVRATAYTCGQTRTAAGTVVPGVPVVASNPEFLRSSQSVSDGLGRYCLGIDGNSGWALGHPDPLAFASGWLGAKGEDPGAAGLTVYPLDALVTGVVFGADGRPLSGIPVTVSHPLGPVMAGLTSGDGSYRLGLASEPSGDWTLLVDGQALGCLPQTSVFTVVHGAALVRNFALQEPSLANTIVITRASYDGRKNILTVEATSEHPDARLQVEGFGAMAYVRLFKGKYYWRLTRSVAVKPASVTVSGPEGSVEVPVP